MNLSAGVVLGERHFFDANARLNPMRERNAGDQTNGGDSGNEPVPNVCA